MYVYIVMATNMSMMIHNLQIILQLNWRIVDVIISVFNIYKQEEITYSSSDVSLKIPLQTNVNT
jgi:hypothetical protein